MAKQIIQEEVQKIQIINISGKTNDPALYDIIKKLVIKLSNCGIKIIMCRDIEDHITAKLSEQNLAASIPIIEKSISQNYTEYFSRTDHLKLPFVSTENQSLLHAKLTKQYPGLDPSEMTSYIVEIESQKKYLSLLKLINKLHIPFFGVDNFSSVEYSSDSKKALKNQINVIENIYVKSLEELGNSNGVIICGFGNMYAKKLTAMLGAASAPLSNQNLDIKVTSFTIHSPYVDDKWPDSSINQNSLSNDYDIPQDMYEEHPTKDLFFKENPVTGEFYNNEWDSSIIGAIKFVEYQDQV